MESSPSKGTCPDEFWPQKREENWQVPCGLARAPPTWLPHLGWQSLDPEWLPVGACPSPPGAPAAGL